MKVIERAKLIGGSAVQISEVGDDGLTVKIDSGEFSAQLTDLHNPSW